MLTPLQERVASIVSGLDEAREFALAGGGALIARGEVDRRTRDLDFFGVSADAVDRLLPAVERALRANALTVERIREGPGFARLLVADRADRTELDLAADARLFPKEPHYPAPTLSGEELAVDKVLAIFGRAEPRDFVDLAAVEPRYGLERLCALAAEKDRGFRPAIFDAMLGHFDRLRRDEFELSDDRFEQLARRVREWRLRTRDLVRAAERAEVQRDDDRGLEWNR